MPTDWKSRYRSRYSSSTYRGYPSSSSYYNRYRTPTIYKGRGLWSAQTPVVKKPTTPTVGRGLWKAETPKVSAMSRIEAQRRANITQYGGDIMAPSYARSVYPEGGGAWSYTQRGRPHYATSGSRWAQQTGYSAGFPDPYAGIENLGIENDLRLAEELYRARIAAATINLNLQQQQEEFSGGGGYYSSPSYGGGGVTAKKGFSLGRYNWRIGI